MSRKLKYRLAAGIGVVAAMMAFVFWPAGDREQVRSRLVDGLNAVEDGDLEYISALIHSSYEGDVGSSRGEALESAEEFFRSTSDRKIDLEEIEIEVDGDSASARILLQIQGYMNYDGGSYLFVGMRTYGGNSKIVAETELIREDGNWTVAAFTMEPERRRPRRPRRYRYW